MYSSFPFDAVTLLPSLAAAQQQPLVVEATPAPVPEEPEPFQPLQAPRASIHKYYTAIRLPGVEGPVYAFTDTKGRTQFRVYGALKGKKGMYPAQVTLTEDDQGDEVLFALEIAGNKPVRDRNAGMARGKALSIAPGEVPPGYRTTTKPGVIWFTNLFRQKEYRVFGQVPGVGDAWYPAEHGRPRRGSLAVDISLDRERFRPEDGKTLQVPRELRRGFAQRVFIFTTDGYKHAVWTDYPMLDVEALK